MSDLFKVALYIRVSTERQANEGDSLEEQENELKKFCDFRQFAIHQTYIERGKSGGNTNRPEYQKLVKDIQERKINAVVVKKLDRLSRSLLDFENLMRMMNDNDVEFISIKENFDTTTAMGKAMLRVALVFAQLEREQTSERLSDVMGYRASQGIYNGGTRPLGYTVINKELVPYKKEKQIVELIFQKFIETRSTVSVATFLNETGFSDQKARPFEKRQIQWILQNPLYTGKIRWNKQLYNGIHQPIISEKLFQDAQTLFSRWLQTRSKTEALLQKLLICGHCGSPMTPSYAFNHQKVKYFYYRCTKPTGKSDYKLSCPIKYVAYQRIESAVIQTLLSFSQETDFKSMENKILKHNQSIEKKAQEIEKTLVQIETKLEGLKEKREKYLDTLIANAYLSQERERINQYISQLEQDEKQLKATFHKTQFALSQIHDEQIQLTPFKQQLVAFRTESEVLTKDQLQVRIKTLLSKIVYYPNKMMLYFRVLPWAETVSLSDRGLPQEGDFSAK